MHIAYLGLGSNVGDRCANLRKAIALIEDNAWVDTVEVSPIYETAPVDFLEQCRFLNCVLRVYLALSPPQVLDLCQRIEQKMRRIRIIRFGPRNIDVDLLFYDDQKINEPGLEVPHPRAHARLFVLKPMCDLAPDFEHPVLHKSIAQLLAEFNDAAQTAEEFKC